MMNNDRLIAGLFIGLFTGVFTYVILTAMALPDVWFSYETNECVQVINYNEGDNYSCENLPKRFYHVWVK